MIFLEGGIRGIYGGTRAGGARFCMSSVDECNTSSHTRKIGSREDLIGGTEEAWEELDPSAPRMKSSAVFQPVLSGATASNVKSFEGLLMSSYNLGQRGKIFQFLKVEAQHTLKLSPEGIRIEKGEVINMIKCNMHFIEPDSEEMSLRGGET